jgi:CheY-like chemotaxis protein
MKKILIIDDEAGIRELIQISLESVTHWQTRSATSGQEGYQMVIAQQPDAILLDLMMPGMDGLEVLQLLLHHEHTRHIPTIFLTAKASAEEHQRLIQMGARGIITKPFKAQHLVERMCEILEWPNP